MTVAVFLLVLVKGMGGTVRKGEKKKGEQCERLK